MQSQTRLIGIVGVATVALVIGGVALGAFLFGIETIKDHSL